MVKSFRAAAALGAALSMLMNQPALAQGVAINTTGAPETAMSILDINSTGTVPNMRGVLIPRMTRAQRVQMSTNVPPYAPGVLGAGDAGMWVYQTDDTPTEPHGHYYWNGATWVRMSYGPGWSRSGNAGTAVLNNFIGTIANTIPAATGPDLVFGTNSVERMRILASNGYVGIGTATPVEFVEVNGGMRIYTTTAPGSLTNTAGVVRYTTASPGGTTNNYHDGYQAAAPAGWARLENAEKRRTYQPYDSLIYPSCGPGQTYINSGVTPVDFGAPGAPFGDPTESPLPTANGDRIRIQYLFQSTELLAPPPTGFGLCAGPITEIAIKMVDGDPQGPTPPAAAGDIYVRINHTNIAGLTTFEPAATTNGSYHFFTQGYIIGPGWRTFPIGTSIGTPGVGQTLLPAFAYDGVSDLVVEVSFTRGANPGYSPRGEMQNPYPATLGFNATRYAYGNGLVFAGYAVGDATFPATTGNTTKRPLWRFTGQVRQPGFAVGHSDYVNYDGALLVSHPNSNWPTTSSPVLKGPGVIAAQYGVYDNLVQLNDHVFDLYFDGTVKPEDAAAAAAYTHVELDELKAYLASERHLPNMPSRSTWEKEGAPSLGQMSNRLWQTVEDQALYIMELERELSSLENKVLNSEDPRATIAAIKASTLLSDQEKERLIATVRELDPEATR